MIIEAIKEIMKIDETIIGYNNLKFDVPLMAERLKLLRKWKPEFYTIFTKKMVRPLSIFGQRLQKSKVLVKKAGIERDFPDLYGRKSLFLRESRIQKDRAT